IKKCNLLDFIKELTDSLDRAYRFSMARKMMTKEINAAILAMPVLVKISRHSMGSRIIASILLISEVFNVYSSVYSSISNKNPSSFRNPILIKYTSIIPREKSKIMTILGHRYNQGTSANN